MKKRYIYSILLGIPGLIFSIILSLVVSAFTTGFLWLFVFGDNQWPSLSETLMIMMVSTVFLVIWLACICLGFVIGKHFEQDPVLNKGHVFLSIGVTILLTLVIVFSQFRVGNIGPKSESVRCSEYCSQSGYPASSMSPHESGERICSCLNDSGNEVIKISIDSIRMIGQGYKP